MGHDQIGIMLKTVGGTCNLACEYCYYCHGPKQSTPEDDRMDFRLMKKLLREYMPLSNGRASFIWQGGEPLLAGLDFFQEMVNLQAHYAPPNTAISNVIQTNATLLTQEWAKFFKNYNFLVGVSIDGPKQIHDCKRSMPSGAGSFTAAMQGIRFLREAGVAFNALAVVHEFNVTKAKEIMQFFRHQGIAYTQFIPCMKFHAQEADRQPEFAINAEQYGHFLCELFDVWYNDGNPACSVRFFDNLLRLYLNQEAEVCEQRKTCPTTLVFEPDGDCYPCDFYISEKFKLGNIGTETLEEILNSNGLAAFLEKKNRIAAKCKECSFLRLCHGGCPRNRTETNADYFCDSYKKVFDYAHDRIMKLAWRIKAVNLVRYIKNGGQLPERNAQCICGSGLKFKKCCGPALNQK